MRIFVTGGSGFLGSRMIRTLVAKEHQVFALARSTSSTERVRALGRHRLRAISKGPSTYHFPKLKPLCMRPPISVLRARAHPISAQMWGAHALC